MTSRIDGPSDDEIREARAASVEQARRAACYPDLLAALQLAIPELVAWSNSRDFEDVHDDPEEDYSKALRAIDAAIVKASPQAP